MQNDNTDSVLSILDVRFYNCIFYNNSITGDIYNTDGTMNNEAITPETNFGLITVFLDDSSSSSSSSGLLFYSIEIINSTIVQNYYTFPNISPIGYILRISSSSSNDNDGDTTTSVVSSKGDNTTTTATQTDNTNQITIMNNCFVDNTIYGSGMILLPGTTTLSYDIKSNYVGTSNNNDDTTNDSTDCTFVYDPSVLGGDNKCIEADLNERVSDICVANTIQTTTSIIRSPPPTITPLSVNVQQSSAATTTRTYYSSTDTTYSFLFHLVLVLVLPMVVCFRR